MQQRDGNKPPRPQNGNGRPQGPKKDGSNNSNNQGGDSPTPRSRIPSWAIAAVVVVILGFWAWNAFGREDNGGRTTVDYSILTGQVITSDNATHVTIGTGDIDADLATAIFVDSEGALVSAAGEGVTTTSEITAERPPNFDDQQLVQALTTQNSTISLEGRQPSGSGFATILLSFLPFLLFLGLILFMARSMGRGQQNVFGFGRSKARQHDPERPQVTFADVAGEDEAKQELTEVVDFLRNPAKYHALGARLPRGVLLVGPPGTGKTLLARAVAGEAGTPFYSVSASEFVEMFVGVGASRVRDLFEKAKASAPAIIFVDELDAVGRQRFAGLGGSNDEREQTLNQMLVEMDGFDTNQEVIVMAATNRPDVLDPALLRPGRFDRQVTIGLPDRRGREAILNIHSRGMPLSNEIDLQSLARGTTGFSGADLANLVNEAALTAARRNRREITPSDFEEALDKVLLGTARTGLMNPKEREIVAYHEAGHAIVAHFTPGSDPLRKVSIVPRGRALGVTVQMPDEDRHNYSRTYLLGRLAMLLGGRAAEMVVYDEVTTGAESDLKEATSLARRMGGLWGMSADVGPIYLGAGEEHVFLGREITQDKSFSDSTVQRLDAAIRDMVETALDRALEVNTRFRPQLDLLVKALLEKETIDGSEVTAIFGPATPEDPNAGMVPRQPQTTADQQNQPGFRVNAD